MCDSSRLVQIDRNEIVASVKMHEMKRCIKEYTHPPARKIKHFVKFEYAGRRIDKQTNSPMQTDQNQNEKKPKNKMAKIAMQRKSVIYT